MKLLKKLQLYLNSDSTNEEELLHLALKPLTGKTQKDIQNELDITYGTWVRILEDYPSLNIYLLSPEEEKKVINERRLKTILEEYGSLENFHKIQRENRNKTMLEKYGTIHALQNKEIYNNMISKNKERWGVENPFELQEVKELRNKSMIERYGTVHALQAQECKEKFKNTCIEKFGVPYQAQRMIDPAVLDLLNSKEKLENYLKQNKDSGNLMTYENMANLLNIDRTTISDYIAKYGLDDLICENINRSEGELELEAYIQELGFETVHKIRYDIIVPELKVGFEYNGEYWHSDQKINDRSWHKNKKDEFEKNNDFLFMIWENEWYNKKDIVKSIICNKLGKTPNRLFARKCILKEVSVDEARKFLDENHIQGYANSSVRIGLFYQDELVELSTFGKSRFNKSVDWELVRNCSKKFTYIVGGFNKILQYFIKTYFPKAIISYLDVEKFSGSGYEKNGFKCISNNKPQFQWVINGKVLNRNPSRHKELSELMKKTNGYRIWHCGSKTYIKYIE